MMPMVHLHCGPPVEAGDIISLFVQHAASHGDDAVALILPTARACEQARADILAARRQALLDPRVFTFPQLAEAVLVANHHPFRRLSPLQREWVLTDILQALNGDPILGDLAPYVGNPSALPGLVSAVGQVLDDLKRAAVEPADFAAVVARRLPRHPANAPLSAIYERYQGRLRALRLYDEPGLFWEALAVLRAHVETREDHTPCRPLDRTSLLLVHGFSEFTTTQLAVLRELSRDIRETRITLWLEEDRPQAFAAAQRTRDLLISALQPCESAFPDATHERPSSRAEARSHNTNLSLVRACAFGPPSVPISEADGTVVLLAAAGGVRAEVREVARQIKSLLLDESLAAHPGQIAVILRSFDLGHDLAIREVFAEYGIPVEMSRGESLARRPIVQAVLDILDVPADDWRRADVVKLLSNGYVDACALMPEGRAISPDEFERMALAARVIGGREAWTGHFRRHAERLRVEHERSQEQERMGLSLAGEEADDQDSRRLRRLGEIERDADSLEVCEEVINRLQSLLAPLQSARTWADAVRALSGVIARLGIPARCRECADPATVSGDLAALSALMDGLRQLAEAPECLGTSAAVTPEDFASRVRRLCSELKLPADRRTGGAVQVLDVHEARQARFRFVFVPGLVEGAFPLAQSQDPFYHDEDRRRLNAEGPILSERLPRQEDDALLLLSALQAADERVWLSYTTSDADGLPHLRSHYVDEILRRFAPAGHGEGCALDIKQRSLSQVLCKPAEVCSLRELSEACLKALWAPATDAALAAVGALWREAPKALARVVGTARVERERDALSDAGPFEGVLADASIHALLRQDALFGPAHHFSPTQLSMYGQCPMRFFLSRVLGLEALEEPGEDLQAIDLGGLLHRALAWFFGQRTEGSHRGLPQTPQDLDEAQAEMAEIVHRVFADAHSRLLAGSRRLLQLGEERALRDLQRLLAYEMEQASPPRAVHDTELAFGQDGSFYLGEGADRVTLEGRIDRVDVLSGGPPHRFVVLDYKLGARASASAIKQGSNLQLPLYSLATRRFAFGDEDSEPYFWAYYRVTRPVGWRRQVGEGARRSPGTPEEVEDMAIRWALAHGASIRAGRFPALPSDDAVCRSCEFETICRRR